jgi:hypothetical protein
MHTSTHLVTTIEQLYATAGAMATPVLIHVDGGVEWGNRSFVQRFNVNDDMLAGVRVKELLWCLGIGEAVAGMVAEGLAFNRCAIPALDDKDATLFLKQVCLTMQPDGRKRMMLVLADEFDQDAEDIAIGDN